jgi:3-deoxy-D-manno-octulosonic-acid transferase
MRLVYSALFILLLPLIVLRLLLRSRRAPAYRQRLGERLGYFEAPARGLGRCCGYTPCLLEKPLPPAPLIERMLDALPQYRVRS